VSTGNSRNVFKLSLRPFTPTPVPVHDDDIALGCAPQEKPCPDKSHADNQIRLNTFSARVKDRQDARVFIYLESKTNRNANSTCVVSMHAMRCPKTHGSRTWKRICDTGHSKIDSRIDPSHGRNRACLGTQTCKKLTCPWPPCAMTPPDSMQLVKHTARPGHPFSALATSVLDLLLPSLPSTHTHTHTQKKKKKKNIGSVRLCEPTRTAQIKSNQIIWGRVGKPWFQWQAPQQDAKRRAHTEREGLPAYLHR
jgi:hypothetical protein